MGVDTFKLRGTPKALNTTLGPKGNNRRVVRGLPSLRLSTGLPQVSVRTSEMHGTKVRNGQSAAKSLPRAPMQGVGSGDLRRDAVHRLNVSGALVLAEPIRSRRCVIRYSQALANCQPKEEDRPNPSSWEPGSI